MEISIAKEPMDKIIERRNFLSSYLDREPWNIEIKERIVKTPEIVYEFIIELLAKNNKKKEAGDIKKLLIQLISTYPSETHTLIRELLRQDITIAFNYKEVKEQ